MIRESTKQTDRFTAEDDDGVRYSVIEFTKFYHGNQVGGPPVTHPGPKHYELDNGLPLNKQQDGSFKIAHNGKIIRKV
jgi:hypothetical protein